MSKRALLLRFARAAGRAAADIADRTSTSDRAWRGVESRLDALPRVGPKTLAMLRAEFVHAYDDTRLDAFAAQGIGSFWSEVA